jgi:hypothetical protein
MTTRMMKRNAFNPSVTEARLEERLVLSSTSSALTPAPAPPPVFSNILIGHARPWRNVAQLRAAYAREGRIAALELRNEVAREISQMSANGSLSSAQRRADLSASVQGAVDATALQLTSQAALLPRANASLVPSIQNSLLGSGSRSLSSRLSSIIQSTGGAGSVVRLQSAISRAISVMPSQLTTQFNSFFTTNNVNQLAVNSSGQQIPLTQFMAGQAVNQISNTLGTLAQSFPTVATSVLFPNGTTSTPTQDLFNQFGVQARNALTTAAMEIGSTLGLFTGSSSVISQIQPTLFGSTSTLNNLASSLQNVASDSSALTSAVTSAFNSSFNNLLGPVTTFFGMPGQANSVLPTTGLTSPFTSQFTASNFDSGFNDGFTSGTNTGFVGFGTAPTDFNTNFATGFDNLVSFATQSLGLVNTPLGTIGTVGGVPVESR